MGSKLLLFSALCLSTFSFSWSQQTPIDDNQMGMSVLYKMVNIFLGDVVHKDNLTSHINLTNVILNEDTEWLKDWKSLLKYWIGYSVCVAIGIVFIVVMPIIGLIFCCCRCCCGRCGAKKKKTESKRGRCKRRAYCTVLLIFNTVALAGCICAFICNSLIYQHLKNDDSQSSVGYVSDALHGVENFLNTSVINVTKYVIETFDTTSQKIRKDINDTAIDAVDTVIAELHAKTLLDEANSISQEANWTVQQLEQVQASLLALSDDGTQLSKNLTEIKQDIHEACNGISCSGFKSEDYDTNANFSSLKSLSDEAEKVKKTLNMSSYIREAETSLDNAKRDASNQINLKSGDVDKTILDVRNKINKGMDELITTKDDALREFPSILKKINQVDGYIKDYSSYGFYAGIGVCCAYILIVALYYVGILFGLCGERPGDGAPCCNTGTGSNFLMAGVAFTFLFSSILMIVCTVLFAVGGPLYTDACRFFDGKDPSKLQVFDEALYKGLNLKEKIYKTAPDDVSVSKILQNCQNNTAVFGALYLDYAIDLDEKTNLTEFEKQLEDLKNQSANWNIQNISILSPQLQNDLTNFTGVFENINFTQYFLELEKNMTIAEIPVLVMMVNGFAEKESSSSTKNQTKIDLLRSSADRLSKLNNETLPRMRNHSNELNVTLSNLQQKSTLKSQVLDLIKNLTEAQNRFNSNKNSLIQQKISVLADNIINSTKQKLSDVKHEIRTNMAPCAPLSNAVFTMSDAVCVLLINPLNGLWFSFGWCLFFFVICLIFAILLTSQYRREMKYEKDFDDPHYPMYGGSNQDTIPLTRYLNVSQVIHKTL
ncbi:prominin-1-A-like isoform X2 [Physella acuta]|uniref:prominin-1-A-like isoform X2 n=1 Tax=Physella acuta TaxID=109671 RepID=UPI0027DC83BE|nr:prominin-1-A-like isoform X2 [Physella acuta]